MRAHRIASVLLLTCLAFVTSCSSVPYDLSGVPFEVSAKPVEVPAKTFRIEKKNVLWVHGLFGQSNPDITKLVEEVGRGHRKIAGFRVKVGGGFHDWLITHLTLTLVRMKTVVIEGQLIDRP